jgi:hypothetical protein
MAQPLAEYSGRFRSSQEMTSVTHGSKRDEQAWRNISIDRGFFPAEFTASCSSPARRTVKLFFQHRLPPTAPYCPLLPISPSMGQKMLLPGARL